MASECKQQDVDMTPAVVSLDDSESIKQPPASATNCSMDVSSDGSPQKPKTELKGTVKIAAADGTAFTIPVKAASMSELLTTMFEGDPLADEYPLPQVTAPVLKLVAEFMVHYVETPDKKLEERACKAADIKEHLQDDFAADFIMSKEQSLVFELLQAANYMNVNYLLEVACSRIAYTIQGCGGITAKVRETFGIVNDFTPDEEARVIEETTWAFEDA